MNDLVKAAKALEQRAIAESRRRRDENRKRMPTIARIVDQIEAVFGKPRVIYAEENGHVLGKPEFMVKGRGVA